MISPRMTELSDTSRPAPLEASSEGAAVAAVRGGRRGFWRAQGGQSMLFTALTIFILFVMVGIIVGVGEVSTDQMRLQNATDAAAYAAAAVQADIMAQTAWLNEGLAAVYYQSLTDSVKNIGDNTQKSLDYVWYNPADAGLPALPGGAVTPDNFVAPTTTNSWGSSGSDGGRDWYANMVRIERLMAVLAPFLIRNQVYQTAHSNFFYKNADSADKKPLRMAIYPNPGNTRNPAWSFYPENGSYHNAVMEHNPTDLGESAIGWRVTSESDPGYQMEAIHVVVDEKRSDSTYNKWHILFDEPQSKGNKDTHYELWIEEVVYDQPYPAKTESPFSITEADSKGKLSSRTVKPTYYTGTMYKISEVAINLNNEDTHYIRTYSDSSTDKTVDMVYSGSEAKNPDGTTNKYLMETTKTSEGTEKNYINGKSYEVKDKDVYIDGVKVANTVNINGKPVPVSAPGSTGSALQTISFQWPLYLNIGNKLTVWLSKNSQELNMSYRFNDYIGGIQANDQRARVHDLTTLHPSERWRSPGGQEGRVYHRLTEYPFEGMNFGDPWDRFKYEITNVGSFLQDMSLRKLAFRGMMVNSGDAPLPASLKSSGYIPQATVPTSYNSKDNTFKTDDGLWTSFTNNCVWDLLAKNGLLWACPPRTPTTSAQAALAGGFGGYLDLSTGQMFTADDKKNSIQPYAYSLTGGKSPYAASVLGSCFTGQWKLMRDAYVYYDNALVSELNPLWNHYASFADDAPTASDGEGVTSISISASNKASCGFFVLMECNPGNDQERQAFLAKVTQLDDLKVSNFYADANLIYSRPYFIYVDKNYWYLAVWDPYGSAAMFNNQPKYPFSSPDLYSHDNAKTKPTWAQIRQIVGNEPALVRRYAYQSLGVATQPAKANFLNYGMGCDIGKLKLGNINALPLEASSQIFRTPVVVCAWKPEKIGWLAPLFGKTSYSEASQKQRDTGLANPLYITSDQDKKLWMSGHFAVSAARVFFKPSQSTDYFTNFSYCGDDYRDTSSTAGIQSGAGLNYPNFVDAITSQHLSGYRQRWIGSLYNLFEPDWAAALVPVEAALRLEDVLPDSEVIDDNDSPAAFLLRQFSTAADNYHYGHHATNDGWIKNAYEYYSSWSQEDQDANKAWYNMTAPPLQGDANGTAVRFDSDNMENVIRH